ncbi:MAG: 1-deoxy-D-xylulose-5-phosphate reductoisomerase, partial [Bacteroidia bacterium]
MPCVLNAANEIAVDAFLNEKISFLQISELVANCISKTTNKKDPSLEDYYNCNTQTRKLAASLIK